MRGDAVADAGRWRLVWHSPATWNVSSALPATLAPAQVPVGAMQGPAGTAAPGLAAAPPFGLEAPAAQSSGFSGGAKRLTPHLPYLSIGLPNPASSNRGSLASSRNGVRCEVGI